MKIKEIILDFTSLLDVIMIILFWYILNYQKQAEMQIAEAQQSAAEAIMEAEQRESEADALLQQASEELSNLTNINERQASILTAIKDFREGNALSLDLVMNEDGSSWMLYVRKGDTPLGSPIPNEKEKQLGIELNSRLSDAGYAKDATVLCIFTYDSSEPGTKAAYDAVTRELKYVQLGNSQFFCYEMDLDKSY